MILKPGAEYNAATVARRALWALQWLLTILLAVWIAGFIFPMLWGHLFSAGGFILAKEAYHTLCHQNQHKCYTTDGVPWFVCARCAGIYFGVFSIFVLSRILSSEKMKISARNWLLAALPMGLHVCALLAGLVAYDRTVALATGLVFGIGTAIALNEQMNSNRGKVT